MTLGTKSVVLNLGAVQFVDSGGLGALVRIQRSLRTDRGDLKICELSESLFKVFQITHLHTVLEMYESEAQAIEAFRQRSSSADEPASAARKKVLCVHESSDVLAYLGVLLRRSGYEVQTTQNVSDFARLLKATKPDAVVAGHGMKAGERVEEALRQAGAQARVLFLPSEFSTTEASEAGGRVANDLRALFHESETRATEKN
jgi:CheY-like chemotaxis protein